MLDVFSTLRCDQKLEPLPRAVDADRDEYFAGDRHRLLKEKRRIGVFDTRQDEPPHVTKLVRFVETPHQAAFAAAAFEELRLEHEARPAFGVLRRLLAAGEQDTARHSEAVAAQQGFPVDLGKTHNRLFPLAPSGAISPELTACRALRACRSSIQRPGGSPC